MLGAVGAAACNAKAQKRRAQQQGRCRQRNAADICIIDTETIVFLAVAQEDGRALDFFAEVDRDQLQV